MSETVTITVKRSTVDRLAEAADGYREGASNSLGFVYPVRQFLDEIADAIDPDAELIDRMACAMWEQHRSMASPSWEYASDDVTRTFRAHARHALRVVRAYEGGPF